MLAWHAVLFAQERFPRPEFESGYVYPEHQMPADRAPVWEYIDLAVLITALSVAAWLALKKTLPERTGMAVGFFPCLFRFLQGRLHLFGRFRSERCAGSLQ